MMKDKRKRDILDNILNGKDDTVSPEAEALDYLIYRNVSPPSEGDIPEVENSKVWEESKENVTIQVWESQAKIRVRVPPGTGRSVESFEREYISKLLRKYNGNISKASAKAEMNYKNFFEKMKRYEIKKQNF